MMANDSGQILARLIERVEGRFFGKYRGQVTDNNDPDNLGRIKAKVPRVLGDEESGWALPAFIYGGASEQGLFALPDVGAGVWIEFEGGDLSYPVWTGTWYTSGAIPEVRRTRQEGPQDEERPQDRVSTMTTARVEITDSNGNTITMDSNTIKIAAGKCHDGHRRRVRRSSWSTALRIRWCSATSCFST